MNRKEYLKPHSYFAFSSALLQLTHHLPLCTDVRSWSQNDQQVRSSCLIQKGNEVPAAVKVIDPRLWLMVVPGHVTEKGRC